MNTARIKAERQWKGLGGKMPSGSVIVVTGKVAKKAPAGKTYYHPTPYVHPAFRPRRQKILAWRSWEHAGAELARA